MDRYNIDADDSLEAQFLNVLDNKNIKTVFQPIISLQDGSIYGYEALSRGPQDTLMQNPQALFEYAEKYDKLWDLEFLCRSKALEAVCDMSGSFKLFLNVNPNIMHDMKFTQGFTKEYLDKFSIDSKRIVFEITEREAINNISDFVKTVRNYKDQNYKIAIDDVGAGYSGLNLISDIRPNFIKLDMNLTRDVDKDVTKQSLIKSMYEFASLTNTPLISEGIETEDELLKLIEIGVHYGQGYFIQKPNPAIMPIHDSVFRIINGANMKKKHLFNNSVFDFYINNICRPLRTISPKILVSQADEIMKADSALPGFCVVEDDVPIGVITRNDLYRHISGRYGYSLYSNKPIRNIMDKEFMCVDHKMTIDIVAKKAMQRENEKIYDFVIVTDEDKYSGIVTVKDLLEKVIEIEFVNAKHLNPLSELPGNIIIEKQLEMAIDASNNSYVLYFDLDNFKAYNDIYGFKNGDRVLKFLTQLLKRIIPVGEFIGHIGGDDFISIISDTSTRQISKIKELCRNIIEEFDRSVLYFYNQDDIDKGSIVTKNRYGIEESFPLLSISISGVASEDYVTIYELTEAVAKLKKACKQEAGSNHMIGELRLLDSDIAG